MWLTVKELAFYIKIKEKTIYYLVGCNSVPHYRIGKLVRFKRDEIDRWMDSKRVVPLKNQVDKIVRSIYTPLKGDQTTSRGR